MRERRYANLKGDFFRIDHYPSEWKYHLQRTRDSMEKLLCSHTSISIMRIKANKYIKESERIIVTLTQ